MATINVRVSDDFKTELQKEAQLLGHSSLSSYLLKLLKARETKSNNFKTDVVGVSDFEGSSTVTAMTRLTPNEKIEFRKVAEKEGESESFLLRRQIHLIINNGPYFSKGELLALRQATTQLTAIGRNLNQLVVKANSGGQVTVNDFTISQLRKYVEEQSLFVSKLIMKTKNRVVDNG